MQPESSKAPWTIGTLVKWATDDFRTRGIENPRLDAELIVAYALKIDRTRVIIESLRPLEPAELSLLRELVRRRRSHEPIAYLRGEREFYGRPFRVDPRVLVPRPDTEALVDVAMDRSSHVSLSMRMLDLCTGSGCVAITIAKQRPTAKIVASDVSAEALAVARENALRLGAYNVAFVESDLFGQIGAQDAQDAQGAHGIRRLRFDVITANPPYIPSQDIAGLMPDVRDFEPRLALDGGADGLDIVRRIIDEAPAFLEEQEGGLLAMEIGAGEAAMTRALFEARGYRDIRIDRDYGKIERVVSGRRPLDQ